MVFSTATQFFKKLETYDLTKIPVIDQELNPVFDGCYTSHSEIKQLNRDAEDAQTAYNAALQDLLGKAGGLTSGAYVFGTNFVRDSVKRQQQVSFDRAISDLELNHVGKLASLKRLCM